MPGCGPIAVAQHLSYAPMPASQPSRTDEQPDFAHSRVSDETLSRLNEFASPTRTSLYDRRWFLCFLVVFAIAVVVIGACLVLQLLH